MADVASNIYDWSTTASSNSPSDATSIGAGLADNFQQIQATVRAAFASKGADIASATTTDLGAVAGNQHDITGTTSISSFGTVSAGVWKLIKFEGALTLTHNATSLILPGAANIITQVGDVALMVSEGSGNWRCASYMQATGLPTAFKVISVVRDMTAASGDVAVTGVGFKPRAVICFATVPSAVGAGGWGFSDGTAHFTMYDDSITTPDHYGATTALILIQRGATGSYQTAIVKTFDSDGATLTWTKVGSPVGTASVYFMFLR